MPFVYNAECQVPESTRTKQIRGMFDLDNGEISRTNILCDFPEGEVSAREWSIGLIVGPSGSGKSTMLRTLFGLPWQSPKETGRALVDEFPEGTSVRDIARMLSSVGFSSPPAWLRPREMLSNGQRFRAEMALAAAFAMRDRTKLVLDEFTSVVDRHAARIGCVAFSKMIREAGISLVVASCHEDIIDWLQPDWIARPDLGTFAWRSLRRRPPLRLEFCRVSSRLWRRFAAHHYLSGALHTSAVCFALIHSEAGPVAFSAWLPFLGGGPLSRREHRTVCLPDFQGIGLGSRISSLTASLWRAVGFRALSTTTHPGLVRSRVRDPDWRMTRPPSLVSGSGDLNGRMRHAIGRLTTGFEYVGPAMDPVLAKRVLGKNL
jgi:ABC-type lipoprotein export system ATPase subunit